MFGADHQIVSAQAVGPCRATTLAYAVNGQLRVAVIVKATFAIAPGATMSPASPDPLHVLDVFEGGDPRRSLRAPSDLVPFRPRCDVLVTGHAWVPLDLPEAQSLFPVRLLLAREKQRQLDKRLSVVARSAAGVVRGAHRLVSLAWELAATGEENPVGVGLPSVRDAAGKPRPVGFGPIAPSWPSRGRVLGDHAPRAVAGLIELGADFPWDFFQSAPEDQRLAHLHGDEWIGLEGLGPVAGRLGTQLPRASVGARLRGLDREALALALDTVHVDCDRALVSLVWRGSAGAASRAALDTASVSAGLALGGAALDLPEPTVSTLRITREVKRRTLETSLEAPPASLPFRARARRAAASIGGAEPAPPSRRTLEPPPSTQPQPSTLDAARGAARPAMPFRTRAVPAQIEAAPAIADDAPPETAPAPRTRARPQTLALDRHALVDAAERAGQAVPFAAAAERAAAPAAERRSEAAGTELSALPFTGQFGPLGQAFLRALEGARARRRAGALAPREPAPPR